tara:strand:+ start:613 stop:1071 length:459 start_codon:yes stop_codon:yes gene_type:complete
MKKLIIFVFLITLSCTNNKVIKNHGFSVLELKSDKIIISKSNKNDILNNIGKPSTVSLFDENTWFYIQRQKVNQSIFKLGKSKINKNIVLEISFNQYGIVKSKKIYDLNDMNDLEIVKNITIKTYDKKSRWGKLLKSFEQKMNAQKLNRKRK